MAIDQKYQEFWDHQTTPLHRHNDQKSYEAYAKELLNIFSYLGYSGGSILEVGCGNGALFPFLNFEHNQYQGIDFSSSLIKIFQESYPNLSLIEADAAKFIPSKKYDLIFGNAIHQHFSNEMLVCHVQNMLSSLSENGIFILANVPYIRFRRHLYGELFPSSRKNESHFSQLKKALFPIYQSLRRRSDGIGYWYSLSDIKRMVGENYKVEIFGSNFYPYRVHFGIKKSVI